MLLLVGRSPDENPRDDSSRRGDSERSRARKWRIGLAIATVVMALIAVGTSSAQGPAPTYEVPTAAQTATLTAAQKQLLESSQPQTIVMDPTNGDIVSVTANSASGSDSSGS